MKIKYSIRDYTVELVPEIKIDFRKGDFLFVDESVYKLYKKQLPKTKNIFVIKATEYSKEWKELTTIIEALILSGFKKNNRLICVGGGVIQDVTGFIASILYRGVAWVFYPTTLVSQADSCIGGKTSINFDNYKNLIGTFYPPSQVFICTKFLETLPKDEIKSGIGEMLHYFVLFDNIYLRSGTFEQDCNNHFMLHPDMMDFYIKESLVQKSAIIEQDEFDKGIRNLFNLGHTFGHALESVSNYKLQHGLAVTKGMDMAFWLAWKRNYISKRRMDYLRAHIEFNMPEFKITDVKKFIEALSHDKKNTDNFINFILPFRKSDFRKIAIKNDDQLLKDIAEYNKQF
jgi:3-dehydroquinate synthase